MKNKRVLAIGAVVIAAGLGLGAQADAAVIVGSNIPTPTLIGAVVAGQAYDVTATGVSNLYPPFNGGQGLTFDADGKPTYAFPSPYGPFYPDGSDTDPTGSSYSPTNPYGQGGAGRLYGSLLGTYTLTPSGPGDFFILGSSAVITPGSDGFLYALVNDDNYTDNSTTGFSVTLSEDVPEPASWSLLTLGLFGVGTMLWQRRRIQSIALRP